MGQAKQRGSREERIAQAKLRQEQDAKKPPSAANPAEMMGLMAGVSRANQWFDGLKTPAVINEQVKQFAQQLGGKLPMFLECQPEPWSRQSCCDLNVAKYIETHGGSMLCGYRIWYNEPRYIEGERHAVWTDGGDTIRDVSFVDTGETKTVFVPDDLAFDDAPGKVRFAFDEADKPALIDYEKFMNFFPIVKMPDAEAWTTYPTYEGWLAGERMPNLIPSFSK